MRCIRCESEVKMLCVTAAGAVVQPPSECWLVMEYLPGGTLAEWLHGKEGRCASLPHPPCTVTL